MIDTGSRPIINSLKRASPKPSKIFVATLVIICKYMKKYMTEAQERPIKVLDKPMKRK